METNKGVYVFWEINARRLDLLPPPSSHLSWWNNWEVWIREWCDWGRAETVYEQERCAPLALYTSIALPRRDSSRLRFHHKYNCWWAGTEGETKKKLLWRILDRESASRQAEEWHVAPRTSSHTFVIQIYSWKWSRVRRRRFLLFGPICPLSLYGIRRRLPAFLIQTEWIDLENTNFDLFRPCTDYFASDVINIPKGLYINTKAGEGESCNWDFPQFPLEKFYIYSVFSKLVSSIYFLISFQHKTS